MRQLNACQRPSLQQRLKARGDRRLCCRGEQRAAARKYQDCSQRRGKLQGHQPPPELAIAARCAREVPFVV